MFEYDKILKSLLNPNLNKQQLAKLIGTQSTQFTSERTKLKNNYSDEDLISAYTSFYFPTNALKLEFLVEHLSEQMKAEISKTHILDIGTGPGTYAFAASELFSDALSFTGVDESKLMIDQANKLNDEYFQNSKISFSQTLPNVDDAPRTLIFGNSINEMGMPAAFKIIKRYNPKFIICIEPGTKDVFKDLLALRKKLLLIDYKIQYPCMGQGTCPLEGIDDWCHQSIKTSLDFELESLSQVAKLDRKVMPATIHFYALEHVEDKAGQARIIRLKKNVKHAFLWDVCDENNKSLTLEVPKKLFKKKVVKQLEEISSGISVRYTIDKVLENATVRVKTIEVEGVE
ncbi:small ribosomal subunit Rsm22 family protein [Halobacteriovorax sp. HFRX-2_2]|uniref:small ribosomal subunit Rsm22 family protein n=1 Tax=unclassified Halobacteriovorax TaxID=2639665 RepID=UPI003724A2CF